MDFFPTMLELAGTATAARTACGRRKACCRCCSGETSAADRTFYWHYPHYHGSTWTPGASIRQGDWKLIEFYEFDEVELYNLASDPGEQNNLVAQQPAKARALRQQLRAWQNSMHAKMPQPNPEYRQQ